MNKGDYTLEIRLAKTFWNKFQLPDDVTFYMTSELENAFNFESFGETCVRDFVENILIYKILCINF